MRVNHPVAPRNSRPAKVTLVVTRPLGATAGRGEPSCATGDTPSSTVRAVSDTRVIRSGGCDMSGGGGDGATARDAMR